jgi:TetR/AcrR family transcriptional regulator, transcriptional repressor for nem operon
MWRVPRYGVVFAGRRRCSQWLICWIALVDLGYAAGGEDGRVFELRSYDNTMGAWSEARWLAKLNYGRTLNLIGAAGEAACQRVKERAVRYGRERKQVTRRRIIEVAGRRFKTDGINGSGIAALMADAGLTNGAFYAHFESKDDLVAATVADQLREQREGLGAAAPGQAGAEQFLREYLSVQHRDSPEHGCPSAALLDEIARSADPTRRAYTDGVLAVIDDVAARVAPDDPQSARVQTLSIYALMVGTLQLSRALADRQLADVVLEQGIQSALTLLGAEGRR